MKNLLPIVIYRFSVNPQNLCPYFVSLSPEQIKTNVVHSKCV